MINIPAKERLIIALDVANANDALALVETIGDAATFYKIGLELFAAGDGRQLLGILKARGYRVFVDLKLFDVPQTVARATVALADSGADFLTVHGNDAIMEAATKSKGAHLKILAVTALTSLDEGDLRDLGFDCDAHALVLSRARRALQCGCDGVVSSGLEVKALREETKQLILVTPGARPLTVATPDDQKRVATPSRIIADGGDYLVVGRPIRDAANPRQAALDIVTQITTTLEGKN